MKYWIWICLDLLIMFGTGVWIYFFPEEALAKGVVGFGILWLVEECKEINRRNKMSENYTVEQNSGENQIEGGVVSIGGSVDTFRCWKCGRTLPISERTDSAYMSNPPKYACKECEGKEKQYRPFKNCSELIDHCGTKLIWVVHKRYKTENLITAYDNDNESIGGSCVFIQDIWVDMKELFDNFTFLDGSPCGKDE